MFWLGLCIGAVIADIGLLATLALCYVSGRVDSRSEKFNKSKEMGDDNGNDKDL